MKLYDLILISVIVGLGEGLCREHWVQFQSSCYLFIDEHIPWTSAQVMCYIMGGKLLEVESRAENDFIVGLLHERPGNNSVWTGLQDFALEGLWVYSSNQEPAEYFNWKPGQPNNFNNNGEGGSDCVYIQYDGLWDDARCENIYDDHYATALFCEAELREESIIG